MSADAVAGSLATTAALLLVLLLRRLVRHAFKSSTPEGVFDEAAKAAVRQWRFMPALRDGEAFDDWREVPMCFKLDGAEVEGCEAGE